MSGSVGDPMECNLETRSRWRPMDVIHAALLAALQLQSVPLLTVTVPSVASDEVSGNDEIVNGRSTPVA